MKHAGEVFAVIYFAVFGYFAFYGTERVQLILGGIALASLAGTLISDALGITSYNYRKG